MGTAGIAYQTAMLTAALHAAHLSSGAAKEVNVGFNLVPAMLSGKVDATLGGYWNYEAIQLRLAHRSPTVIPVDQAGVPTYDELVLVVRENEARTRGQDLRAFLQALSRGEREVRADPAAAAALVVKANPSLQRKLQLESIRQTLPAAAAAAGQALRLAGSDGLGALRRLDVRAAADQPPAGGRTASLHQRVPARAGDLRAS